MQIFTPAVLVFELFGKLNKKFDCFSGELLTLHGTKGQSEDLLITSIQIATSPRQKSSYVSNSLLPWYNQWSDALGFALEGGC